MAITEDSSTPAIVTSTGTPATLVTGTFTPPSGSLLVALFAIGGSSTPASGTITDSAGYVWTVPPDATAAGGTTAPFGGFAGIAFTFIDRPVPVGGITVTASFSGYGTGSGGAFLAVRVLNGAGSVQTNAGAANILYSGTSTTTGTVPITTTTPDSVVYGISDDDGNGNTWTANGSTTGVGSAFVAASFTIVAWKSTNATVTPGTVTLGGTWSSATWSNIAALEILPFGASEPPNTVAPPAFVQSLGTVAGKNLGATVTITSTATVTVGNTIIVGYSALTNSTGTTSATDNLGNVYTVVDHGVNTLNSSLGVLLVAPVTVGGALTAIHITSTGGSAQAAMAGEFSGLGSLNAHANLTGSGTNINAYPGVSATTTAAQITNHLWIGVIGWKGPVGTFTTPVPSTSGVAASEVASPVGTTGGSSGSNQSTALIYFVCNATTSNMLNGQISTSANFAAAGADYANKTAPPFVAAPPSLLAAQALARSTRY